jgi:hypothetical protein
MMYTCLRQEAPRENGAWVTRLTYDRKIRGTKACRESGVRGKSENAWLCKTRVVRSGLHYSKSNSDRDIPSPVAILTQRDDIVSLAVAIEAKLSRTVRY